MSGRDYRGDRDDRRGYGDNSRGSSYGGRSRDQYDGRNGDRDRGGRGRDWDRSGGRDRDSGNRDRSRDRGASDRGGSSYSDRRSNYGDSRDSHSSSNSRPPPQQDQPRDEPAQTISSGTWDAAKEAQNDPTWARIYISNLPTDITSDELQEMFGALGVVAREKQKRGYKDQWPFKIKVYTDDNGQAKGDAVLTYEDANAARTAPSFFDGTRLCMRFHSSLWSLMALYGLHPQAKRSARRRSKWSWLASPSHLLADGKAAVEAEAAALVVVAAAAAVVVVVVVATMAIADTVEAAVVVAAISAIDRTADTGLTRMYAPCRERDLHLATSAVRKSDFCGLVRIRL